MIVLKIKGMIELLQIYFSHGRIGIKGQTLKLSLL